MREQSAYGIEVRAGLETSYWPRNADAALLNARFEDFHESDGDITVSRERQTTAVRPGADGDLGAVVTPASMWRVGAGVTLCRKRYADSAQTVREPSIPCSTPS